MKKIKVSEATGIALDWLVAKCEGYHWSLNGYFVWNELGHRTKYTKECPPYSTDWSQGGPIKTRELIATRPRFLSAGYQYPEGKWVWQAYLLGPENLDSNHEQEHESELAAAMRCYVASKLGEEVEVPEELT